jgi:hypothetical protein
MVSPYVFFDAHFEEVHGAFSDVIWLQAPRTIVRFFDSVVGVDANIAVPNPDTFENPFENLTAR